MFEAAALELLNAREVDAAWLVEHARRWRIEPAGEPTELELADVRRVRATLRRLTETLAAGRTLSDEELAEVNALLARAPVQARLLRFPDHGYYVEMRPVAERWTDAAIREIAGSWASLVRRDDPPRLRLCENAECRRAFYDESKNRTRRWCDTKTCGNRMRVRRHRARHAA